MDRDAPAATVQIGSRRACWSALGTSVVVQVGDPSRLGRACAAVRRELDEIDGACSRFKAHSELCRVNARAGRAQRIGALLADVIELALGAAALTKGAVDPTVGQDLVIAGYDRDFDLIRRAGDTCGSEPPSTIEGSPARKAVTLRRIGAWEAVQLDRHKQTVTVPHGTSLDLGVVAKAWAADRAADAASRAAAGAALVSVGGDLAVSGSPPRGGWPVRVTDDHRRPPQPGDQTIRIMTGGLATSSTAVRRWWHRGREMHHIIDPRTGAPARSPWRTVSVAAASCVEANIAATAALVKTAGAPGWLSDRHLPSRLVDHRGAVVHVAGWPHAEANA